MKAKRLWIARGWGPYRTYICFHTDKMSRRGYDWVAIGNSERLCGCYSIISRLTGLKLKPGEQIKHKVIQTKKGFNVEKD